MIDVDTLVKAFARNVRVLEMQTEGLTHEDSLIQTGHNINCLNWTLGHIVSSRDDMLARLGHDGVMSPAAAARYARESDKVLADGPDILQLEELLALARRSQERIADVLGAVSHEELTAEHRDGDRVYTLGARIHFSFFHDSYHTGQTELLRQLAGTNDAII